MTARTIGALDVPGATLHYEIQGSGPPLLILQGGDGDAGGAEGIVRRLVARYTVITYDRRGLSRSPVVDPSVDPGVGEHSDDAARLLAALAPEGAFVFGASLGALIGLDLVARYPERVRLLVAHEAPATELLPEAERVEADCRREEVEDIFRREGLGAAMRQFVAITGMDFDDREADVELPRPNPERIANLEFFLTHDAPAARRYRLDLPALRAVKARILPAAGSSSLSAVGAERCARALAELLGAELAEFPGGHNGFLMRPKAFAARLIAALEAPDRQTEHE